MHSVFLCKKGCWKMEKINLIAYDWIYQNVLENDRVFIQGKLDTKMQVEVEHIKNFGCTNVTSHTI